MTAVSYRSVPPSFAAGDRVRTTWGGGTWETTVKQILRDDRYESGWCVETEPRPPCTHCGTIFDDTPPLDSEWFQKVEAT